ncbi:hypothetical protein NDU88_000788 [Pleurodeles waltl]|uniref:Uncharacterized protein n=1 Tax=Pleurodeles waltl TaxID=8319 RepID=A0AAV7R8C0_PLEWA|nr:hypothetical protein NDU88_000788 [Pleurodeles waltl]
MQEDLLLPLCGVRKGWEPKRQATPRAGACQAQKRSESPARETLLSQIGSVLNAPSGDRPSLHHALGQESAARDNQYKNARNADMLLAPGSHNKQSAEN